MRRFALIAFVALSACGGSTDKTGSTSTGGSGGSGGSTGGSGGSTGGSGGSGGSSATGGATSGGGSAGLDAGFTCSDAGIDPDAGVEAAIGASCVVAVVKVLRIDEECSGAGGAHITLDVVKLGRGSGVTRVSHGGHAYYPPPEGPDTVGEYLVAGIDPFGSLMPQEEDPGWCITGLPLVDGAAHTFLQAQSEADAVSKMNAILGI